MVRATHIVSGVLVLAARSVAAPAADVEVGGNVGGASTQSYNTGPCPVLLRSPAAPADDCVSNPHNGEQGLVVGVHIRYHLPFAVSVEAGLMYAQKGYNDGNPTILHYLEAPLLVRIDPLAAVSPARVFVVGGLAPAILVACREYGPIVGFGDYSGSCTPEPYLDRTPDRFDLSGVLGVGLAWQFEFGAIEIEARLVRGLVDVNGWATSGKTVNDATYVLAGFERRLQRVPKIQTNPFLDEKRGKFLCYGFATSDGIRMLSAGTSGTSATGNDASCLQGISGVDVLGLDSLGSIPMRFRHVIRRERAN